MEIFILENGIVRPTKEILLVFPFQDIWERDTSSHRAIALAEFSYIEFLVSPKKANPFYGYTSEDNPDIHRSQRARKIIESQFRSINLDWQPDDVVKNGVRQYQEFYYKASPSLTYYESAVAAAETLKTYFKTFNLDERTKSGGMVLKAKDITNALTDTKMVLTNLNSIKEQVYEEVYNSAKTKNNKVINDSFER